MPRRTNAFQTLVATISEHIRGEATVTESKMLQDIDTGTEREVDICIEHMVAGHLVRVCIECSSHNRPRDVSWVEQMHSKHLRLPTNLLVLASESGFTPEALKKARYCRIETAVPESLPPSFGTDIVGKIDILGFGAMDLTPERVRFGVEATADQPEEVVAALSDNVIFSADGKPLAFAQWYANEITRHLDVTTSDSLRNARGDETHFSIVVEYPLFPDPITGEKVEIFLQKEEPTGNYLRRITFAEISGPARVRVGEIPLTHGELQGTGYSTGSAILSDGEPVYVVATETTQGERRLTFRPPPTSH
ncbi:hypothetical protein [Nocardia blacklockiae]|uniref:hypothetical protein n=1 Tax=Nocardia blacklockiae TaxID=480036 RepID=UPI0018939DD7|nr:hypothetical protein [Nocardia blacklockiae]MBF6173424.1 hypothetical protein [Nocardia blacklockiae]